MRYIDNTQTIRTSRRLLLGRLDGNLVIGADAEPARPSDCIASFLDGAWMTKNPPARTMADDRHARRIQDAINEQIEDNGANHLALEDADFDFLVKTFEALGPAVFPQGGLADRILATFRESAKEAPAASSGCASPAECPGRARPTLVK